MKFRFSYFVLLLFILSASNSYAKSKLVPGYIITLDNDTLNGYLEYNRWKHTPQEILFKESKNDIGSHYTPKTISEFCINGKVYRSAIVKIDQSPYKTSELSFSPDFQFIVDTTFLQALILGNKELYYLNDSVSKENFYIKTDSGYVWLMYKRFVKEENDKKLILANNNYILQLLIYLQDCDAINSALSVTTYDQKSLTNVFYYYYECTNSKIDYQEKEDKHTIFFWLN